MAKFQETKQVVRDFMRNHYTDERLAMLLAHTRDGKLGWFSCCCFAGIPTAQHRFGDSTTPHGTNYFEAYPVDGTEASKACLRLMCSRPGKTYDESLLGRVLVPMIRAEMKRRELAKQIVSLPTGNEHVGEGVPMVSCSGGES